MTQKWWNENLNGFAVWTLIPLILNNFIYVHSSCKCLHGVNCEMFSPWSDSQSWPLFLVCLFVVLIFIYIYIYHYSTKYSARVWLAKTFENTFIGAFILLSSVQILGLYRPQYSVPVNWQGLGPWGEGMGLIKHHPGPRPYRWTMHVSLGSELCRGGVVRGDVVSTDLTANTVSANTVIVALQLPNKARI